MPSADGGPAGENVLHRCIRLRKSLQKNYGPRCEVQIKFYWTNAQVHTCKTGSIPMLELLELVRKLLYICVEKCYTTLVSSPLSLCQEDWRSAAVSKCVCSACSGNI